MSWSARCSAASFYALHAPWFLKSLGSLLLALLVGFEAASLWRWTLTRRGWKTLGFVVGDDEENAERRFFAAWTARAERRRRPRRRPPRRSRNMQRRCGADRPRAPT